MKFKKDRKGTAIIEYALIATIIFLCSVSIVNRFHDKLVSRTNSLSEDFPDN